ncbi:MAG TPA: hypothetical protein VFD80_05885 [Flavobacteriaceae bacterium]|nr:hypothetical protein [Flavobacteriaceae bacterium]
MDLVETIVNFFKKPEEETKDKAPDGVCALCWGRQQYNGKIRTLYKDKQIDVNNHRDSYMLMQDFVKKHIDGITLKSDLVEDCPNCNNESVIR